MAEGGPRHREKRLDTIFKPPRLTLTFAKPDRRGKRRGLEESHREKKELRRGLVLRMVSIRAPPSRGEWKAAVGVGYLSCEGQF